MILALPVTVKSLGSARIYSDLPVDGDSDKKRWVMVVSVNWAQEQYFIGDFDGTSFKLMENHPAEPLYVDKGLDFYASRTFQDFDGTLDSKISMGWIATWDYAPVAPSKYGKGFWSIPRNLELKTYKEGVRLVQKPVEQLQTLRHKPASVKRALSVGTQRLPGFVPDENVYELDASFSTDVSNTFGLNLCVGEGRKVVVSYDTDSHNLVIDRTHCSDVQIPKFSRMAYARVEPVDNKIRLHIFVDKSSIEIFANDGKDVFTLLTYPGEAQTGIELFAQKKGTKMELDAWMLKSIWR
ncbi:GH32 C-terminal domain-containing protein [Bacteroides uniformis]|nr:GH32 C-terminal domain-containing protein [Bacteroides uniformis]